MADQFGYLCSIEAPGAPQCLYASFQEMGIKDDFHEKSILVCIDELCGQQTDNVSSFIVFFFIVNLMIIIMIFLITVLVTIRKYVHCNHKKSSFSAYVIIVMGRLPIMITQFCALCQCLPSKLF